MRIFLLLSFLFFIGKSFGQWNYREDTTCYEIQKISIPYGELHDQEVVSPLNMDDLFSYVVYLNLNSQLKIDNIQASERPILPEFSEIVNGLHQKESIHKFFDYEMMTDVYAYELVLHSDVIMNDYGEPVIQVNESGDLEFVWSDPDTIIVTFYSISDIIITIQRTLDWDEQAIEQKSLSFVMTGPFGDKRAVFSVSLDSFMEKMSEHLVNVRVSLPWYEKLLNDNFRGFRYHQEPCGYGIATEN